MNNGVIGVHISGPMISRDLLEQMTFIYHTTGIVIELQGVLQPTTSAASDPRGAQVAGAASEAVGEHEARPDGRRALRAESVQPAAAEREAEAEL